MARNFSKDGVCMMTLPAGTVGSLVNGASQISFAAWMNASSFSSAKGNYVFVCRLSTNNAVCDLGINGTGGNVLFGGGRSCSGDSFIECAGITGVTLGAWHHVGIILDYAARRIRLYLDGVQEASAVASSWASSVFQWGGAGTWKDSIGSDQNGSAANQFAGSIAEACIWPSDIGAAGFSALAKGFNPYAIGPKKPVLYFPLNGQCSPEIDPASGKLASIAGSIPSSAHPGIVGPAQVLVGGRASYQIPRSIGAILGCRQTLYRGDPFAGQVW